jgi:N-acyl-D-aspartate/D-glutamate deacylase
VRDEKIMTLHDAIAAMTSKAAQQMGITDRGKVGPGLFADLVIFDPAAINDTATYDNPHQYPDGIDYVIVNGNVVLDPKGLTGSRPGRPIYGPARRPS